jgi:sarcosine oxidase
MKVAVIGVGGTGSAAARWLVRAGHEVIAFEQFQIGHGWGSSHGASRIIRYTYPDAAYTDLMRQAYPLWRALEVEAREDLLTTCGGLYLGHHANPTIAQAQNALMAHGVASEILAPDAVHARFPALNLSPEEVALYQADMGFLRPERCVLAQVRLAQNNGAAIYEETAIRKIERNGSGVIVVTETGEEHRADRAIVTAGPWMGRLLADLHLPLCVTRQQVVQLKPRPGDDAQFAPERFPVWIDADTLRYGFPQVSPGTGVKLALHIPGDEFDPDRIERSVDPEFVAQTIAYTRNRFDGLTDEVVSTEACLYTNTPDEDFILDTHPAMPNVFIASGCSGHGFKFTVLLGKIAAEAVTGVAPPPYLEKFSLRRFL